MTVPVLAIPNDEGSVQPGPTVWPKKVCQMGFPFVSLARSYPSDDPQYTRPLDTMGWENTPWSRPLLPLSEACPGQVQIRC